jgi:aryl-alcohol dehydrogenase-like predicted oxidoreductase
VQLAIAWVLSRGEDVIPLVGARTRAQLRDALGVLHLRLSPADIERVGQIVSPDRIAGTRYDAAQMAMLDSERKATTA